MTRTKDEFLEERDKPDASRVHIEISCPEEPSLEVVALIEHLKPQITTQNGSSNK